MSEEHKRLFDRVKETEKELSRLKSENIDLKTSLHKIMEKEENDRKYRLEIEKVVHWCTLQKLIILILGEKRNEFNKTARS